jgi:hypothetical protein
MSNKVRIPSPWSQLFLFMGLLMAMYVFASLLYQVAIENHLLPGMGAQETGSMDLAKVFQALFSVMVFALTAFIYARLSFSARPGYQLGLRPAARGSFYLLAILLLVFALPLEEWLGELNKRIPLWHWMVRAERENDSQVETFIKVRHAYDPVVNILVMAAIPAFCEELCFRGGLQRIMIQICKRPLAGILLSAILFSCLHFQFEGFLPRVFLGVLLGLAYWFSGSLWVAIIAHFFFNAAQIIIAMYDPGVVSKSPSIPLLFVLLSLVIIVGLLSFMRSRSTTTYAGVYET